MNHIRLPFHKIDFVDFYSPEIPIDEHYYRQADRGLGGRYGDYENSENLSPQSLRIDELGEGHEIDGGRIKQQFDSHQNADCVSTGQ